MGSKRAHPKDQSSGKTKRQRAVPAFIKPTAAPAEAKPARHLQPSISAPIPRGTYADYQRLLKAQPKPKLTKLQRYFPRTIQSVEAAIIASLLEDESDQDQDYLPEPKPKPTPPVTPNQSDTESDLEAPSDCDLFGLTVRSPKRSTPNEQIQRPA